MRYVLLTHRIAESCARLSLSSEQISSRMDFNRSCLSFFGSACINHRVRASGAEVCVRIESFIILDAHRQLTPNASVKTIQIAIITCCSTPIAAVFITGSNDRLATKFPTESTALFLAVGVIRGGWKTEASVASCPEPIKTVEFRPIDGKSSIASTLLPTEVMACLLSGVPIKPETRQLRVRVVFVQR